jgi:gliding motility-associated lipoprotein GldH
MEAKDNWNRMKRLSPFGDMPSTWRSMAAIVTLLAIMTLQSCSSHWAEADMEFESGCWNKGDTLTLEFESQDTNAVYQLSFPITVNEDYPFHNIYLHAILRAPSGDASLLENEFILADRTGAWLSEPSGDVIPFQLHMGEGLRFNQTGKYSLKLFHFMRQGELCGVEKAGIIVDPVANE